MSKVITLLGSTGSIGTQSLDVCRMHGYEVFGLSANSSVDKLLAQIAEFHPKYVAVTDNSKCKNYIDQCHKRNKLLCDLTDSLNSAKKDQTDQNCKHNSDNQIQCSNGIFSYDSIIKKCRIDCCCDCIHLCCISRSKYSQNSECSEQISQPVPMLFQTIFDIIHRSTDTISFCIRLMEMNCKSNFGKLCTHSKKC